MKRRLALLLAILMIMSCFLLAACETPPPPTDMDNSEFTGGSGGSGSSGGSGGTTPENGGTTPENGGTTPENGGTTPENGGTDTPEGDGTEAQTITWTEYSALAKTSREAFRKSFENKVDFIKWYQEEYRLLGEAGSLESKPRYMQEVDKTGFPTTILTYEEYSFADWRVQEDYVSCFEESDDFFRWYNEAKRIYETEQNYEEVDGNGDIDMGN